MPITLYITLYIYITLDITLDFITKKEKTLSFEESGYRKLMFFTNFVSSESHFIVS